MSFKKYNQFCGLARSLDLIGERWTLLIIRDLLLGPRQYSDILRGLPGLTPSLLVIRLRKLAEAGIIFKNGTDKQAAYQLTENGRDLEPAILALGGWGEQYLAGGPTSQDLVNIAWAIGGAIKRRYKPVDHPWVIAVIIAHRSFELRFGRKELHTREGHVMEPDLTLTADAKTIQSLFFMQKVSPTLKITGNPAAWEDFVLAFSLLTDDDVLF